MTDRWENLPKTASWRHLAHPCSALLQLLARIFPKVVSVAHQAVVQAWAQGAGSAGTMTWWHLTAPPLVTPDLEELPSNKLDSKTPETRALWGHGGPMCKYWNLTLEGRPALVFSLRVNLVDKSGTWLEGHP